MKHRPVTPPTIQNVQKKPPLLRAESSVKRVVKKQKDYPSAASSKLLGLLTHFDAIVAKSPAYHSLESAFSTRTITSVLNENRSEANIPETKVPRDIVVLLETAIKNFGAEFDGNGTTLGGMGSATFSALESVLQLVKNSDDNSALLRLLEAHSIFRHRSDAPAELKEDSVLSCPLKKAKTTGSLPAVKYTLLQANMFVEDMASKQSLGLFFRPAVPKLDTLFQFMCTRRSEALKAALQTKVLGFVSCRLSLTPPPPHPCSLVFMYLDAVVSLLHFL